ETSPPENACPPPDTLTCQSKLGSLPLPFDWYGPATFRLIGCESWATPFTFASMFSVMSALGIDCLKALSISARASLLLPPPPPQPAMSTAASRTTTGAARTHFVFLCNGNFLQVKGLTCGEGTSRS